VRLRIVNAGADTAFRVALAGHRLTVTHTDGFPVRPVTGDALLVGMGERYDAVAGGRHRVAGDDVAPPTAHRVGGESGHCPEPGDQRHRGDHISRHADVWSEANKVSSSPISSPNQAPMPAAATAARSRVSRPGTVSTV